MENIPPSFLLLALLVCLGFTTRIQACFHEENRTTTTTFLPITSRLLETGSAYDLVLNIPGVKTKDLDLSVDYEDRRLDVMGIIRDEDAATPAEPDVSYYQQSYWIINDKVNLYDVTMSYNDGVVTVSVPKPPTPTVSKRKKTKIRGANTTSNKKTNDALLVVQQLQQQQDAGVLLTPTTQASADLLHYRHDATAPPRAHPDISIVHAPRIAQMSEIDEEFEYWNHLI